MTAAPPTSTSVSLGEIADRILHRRGVVVACVVGFALVAVAFGSSRPVTYEATAVLTVAPLSTDPFDDPANRVNIATEREVVRSTAVARRVSDRILGQPSPVALVRDVRVTAPNNSQVMEVTVSASSPVAAAERANAFAAAYLEVRRADADEVADRFITSLEERADVLRSQLEDADDGSAEAITFQQQLSVLSDRQAQLETVALNPGRVISKAEAPTEPSSPGTVVYLAAGILLGGLVGVALALAFDRADRTVHDPRRLMALLDQETLIETVTSGDPDEPYRRAMLILQRDPAYVAATAGSGGSVPVVVLLSVDGAPSEGTGEQLRAAARASGWRCLLASAPALDPADIDRGWPSVSTRQTWAEQHDLVIIDGMEIASTARRLVLAERADLTVLIVPTDAHTAAVEDLLDGLDEVDCPPRLVLAVAGRAVPERLARWWPHRTAEERPRQTAGRARQPGSVL